MNLTIVIICTCIACEIGFYGKNCEHKCPYPKYGRDCQSQCNCSVAKCDHVNGCEHSLVGMYKYFFN